MSLLWASRFPWSGADEDAMHDGVESFSDISVAHPDDTPWHDEELMRTARVTHGPWNPHGDYQALQSWLDKDSLEYFSNQPERLGDEPVTVLHDEDSDEHYLMDGHNRAVVARHLGRPQALRAKYIHVSRARLP